MDAAAVRVRVGTEADATVLAEVGAETFYDSYVRQMPEEALVTYLREAFGREKQAGELAEEGGRFFIAEADGEVVGYARLITGVAPPAVGTSEPCIELQRIYVRKAWLGRNAGAALMGACLAWAREAGYGCIWLGVWEQNRRAIAFYEKWGFEAVGDQPFLLGSERQTDILMRRLLT